MSDLADLSSAALRHQTARLNESSPADHSNWHLQKLAIERNLAIVCITATNRDGHDRQSIAGSSKWSNFADNVVILDSDSRPDTVTALMIPQHGGAEVIEGMSPINIDAIQDHQRRRIFIA